VPKDQRQKIAEDYIKMFLAFDINLEQSEQERLRQDLKIKDAYVEQISKEISRFINKLI
jgi:hypothetical protein